MKTCTKHEDVVVVYLGPQNSQDPCPICKLCMRLEDAKTFSESVQNALRQKLREAEDDVARSHADRRCVSDVNDGFVECAACKEKPGTPILCDSCYQNRKRISGLVQWQNEVREFWERYN